MNLNDILSSRRSIRKFSTERVEKSIIDKLTEATLKAPSSRNSRSTHLLAISNSAVIERLASMRDYGSAFIKDAPLFILVMGDKDATDLWEVNCSISATIMQLAATDLGLASCWVHIDGRPQRKNEVDGAAAEEFVRTVVDDIPSNFGILCGIAIGYSDFSPAPLPPFDARSHIKLVE